MFQVSWFPRWCRLGLLVALALSSPAPAASITDFTLSNGIVTGGPQQLFSLTQVNPASPLAQGVNIGMLVSYGSIATSSGSFTGMFFEFANWSGVPNDESVLTKILFETEQLISNPSYVGWSGDQVSYSISDIVHGMPGGFQIEFATSANPTKPGGYVNNGVAEGEHLLLGFTINPNNTNHFETLLGELVASDWIIGAHLQSVTLTEGREGQDSVWLQAVPDSGTNNPPPLDNVVPLPGAAGMGALGLGLLMVSRTRLRSSRPASGAV